MHGGTTHDALLLQHDGHNSAGPSIAKCTPQVLAGRELLLFAVTTTPRLCTDIANDLRQGIEPQAKLRFLGSAYRYYENGPLENTYLHRLMPSANQRLQ